MTQNEIVEMARQAGIEAESDTLCRFDGWVEPFVAFANLVAAKALAQTQEPVAWMDADGNVSDNNDHKCFPIPLYTTPPQRTEPVALEAVYETIIQWDEGGGKRSRRELARRIVALYTTPPQRTWVGLTVDELIDLEHKHLRHEDLARAIEAKLKELNT